MSGSTLKKHGTSATYAHPYVTQLATIPPFKKKQLSNMALLPVIQSTNNQPRSIQISNRTFVYTYYLDTRFNIKNKKP
jgi:hypothetical protein